MADDDIDVTVTDEPDAPDGAAPSGAAAPNGAATSNGAAAAAPSGSVDEGVAELQRKLDESERARAAAEQRADQAFQRATAAETTAHGSQMAIILGAIETVDANLATLEAQHEEALAAGNFKGATQAARQMAQQEARKVDLERGKAALEARSRAPTQVDPSQLDDSGKVDLYVANMQPRAAAWIRSHPDYVTDPAKNTRLLAKHWAAKEAGHTEGTDSYFQFIEQGLGMAASPAAGAPSNGSAAPTANGAGGTTEQPLSAAAAPAQRRDVQPSPAGPSRGGGGSRTIRLTPAQQEAARMSGLTNEEYARNMVREQQAGNIGKSRVH